jgi:predicted O-methyltransferase YrrM
MQSPSFTKDWCTNNIGTWKRYLKKYKNHETKALEVGSYEGRSAIWMLDNVLTHEKSHITCVDNFTVGKDVHKRFTENMKPYQGKFKLYKEDSKVALKRSEVLKQHFDIIYIDGSRHSRNVLEDAILCFDLLKPNGLMIFDDYTDSREHDQSCPKPAINAFLDIYASELQVLLTKWQVILKKREKPLPVKTCKSEFYTT